MVDMNPSEQPLQTENTQHKEPCALPHVSPLTGEKQSQRALQVGHLTIDYVDHDGPNPHFKEALHLPKHPASQLFSLEQESVTPKQMRPDQQEKECTPTNLHVDHNALPVPIEQPMNIRNEQPNSTELPFNSNSRRGEASPDQAPRQLEDSTAQYENPLQKELDDDIHQQAAEVIQEVSGGRQRVKTDLQRPFDPNLVCPMCRRQFRIGEIQKFRRHVNTCAGTDDD